MLGLGVMINRLGGNEESSNVFNSNVGKVIKSITFSPEALHFVFDDGEKMRIFDNGQSCCESRYMTCDDDLAAFVGAALVSGETAPAQCSEDGYGVHEVQFLRIYTSKGVLVCETHNEHNGYYGGFSVIAEKEN